MNNRYISLKLEDSVLQKLARYLLLDIPEMQSLAKLVYSICSKVDNSEISERILYATAKIPQDYVIDQNFVDETEGLSFHQDLQNFETLEKNCSFQNLVFTTPSSWKAEISRTLIAFTLDNFKTITDLLHKSLSWEEFSNLPVAFLHLSKKFQPRMFNSSELVCIILNGNVSNLLKLPSVKKTRILEFIESTDSQYSGIFIKKGEAPLLLNLLHDHFQNPDEITFLGNAKPPISIKVKQFKKMQNFISFEIPKIKTLEPIPDHRIDVTVNAHINFNVEKPALEQYSYIAFPVKILSAYFDELQTKIDIKSLKYQLFTIDNNEKLILFDERLTRSLDDKVPELLPSALFFKQLSQNVYASHILEFKPKPDADWYENEFMPTKSNREKSLLFPNASKINEFMELQKKEIQSLFFKNNKQINSISVLKIGQNWLPAEDLTYTLNPKLGEMLEKQHQTSLDRIK